MSPPLTGNATQGNKFIWKTAAHDLGPAQLSTKAGMCDVCLPKVGLQIIPKNSVVSSKEPELTELTNSVISMFCERT